ALDAKGRMLAVAYDSDVETLSVGRNYAYRSYFHGGPGDREPSMEVAPGDPPIIDTTHLSTAFLSTSTGTWKIAVSTPIYRSADSEAEICGVLALTINLGDFVYFRSNQRPERFAVLIDGRPGPHLGVVLQHPLLDRLNSDRPGSVSEFQTTHFRVTKEQLQQLHQDPDYRFRDPLSQAPGGAAYRGDWIAAAERVRLPDVPSVSQEMIVLVQERWDEATQPVKLLGSRLKREGLWALAGVVGVILVLWYVVIRVLGETAPARIRKLGQ
ncbi:MAG: cache domain-containing protein, partial [Pirellulaceae bacterium]